MIVNLHISYSVLRVGMDHLHEGILKHISARKLSLSERLTDDVV